MKLMFFLAMAFAMFVTTIFADNAPAAQDPAEVDTFVNDILNQLHEQIAQTDAMAPHCTLCKSKLIPCVDNRNENLDRCYRAFCHDVICGRCGFMDCRPYA
ncbi:hypothetical protein BDV96DRAFT_650737 [Lophiotrema nucula]|uniref:Uncharacterized protein n=1 Tax=Lophiotrema nucula TaxID=690887 RepID=A0A6A5YV16_9PLEO|nr:hypothetical protein BDV96DRAFT_650737 [Lophiotrema nucula]